MNNNNSIKSLFKSISASNRTSQYQFQNQLNTIQNHVWHYNEHYQNRVLTQTNTNLIFRDEETKTRIKNKLINNWEKNVRVYDCESYDEQNVFRIKWI